MEGPLFSCKECGIVNSLENLEEVEEEKEHHAHYICPECGCEKFEKLA